MTSTMKKIAIATAAAKKKARHAQLLSRREVMDRVGLSYPTIWAWMQKGRFPRSRDVGGKVAWIEAEVDQWIADLPVRRLKGDSN